MATKLTSPKTATKDTGASRSTAKAPARGAAVTGEFLLRGEVVDIDASGFDLLVESFFQFALTDFFSIDLGNGIFELDGSGGLAFLFGGVLGSGAVVQADETQGQHGGRDGFHGHME